MLVDPVESLGRPAAAVPLLMATLYLPAVWASLAQTDQRRPVLRGTVIASIVMAFAGGALLGPAVFVALLPSTVLLWLATGGMRR